MSVGQEYSYEDLFVALWPLSENQDSKLYLIPGENACIVLYNCSDAVRERGGERGTSMFAPSLFFCWEGTNSTMWSVTDKSQAISFLHLAFLSADIGSKRDCSPKTEAESHWGNEKTE